MISSEKFDELSDRLKQLQENNYENGLNYRNKELFDELIVERDNLKQENIFLRKENTFLKNYACLKWFNL